jgi:hypothetical protein
MRAPDWRCNSAALNCKHDSFALELCAIQQGEGLENAMSAAVAAAVRAVTLLALISGVGCVAKPPSQLQGTRASTVPTTAPPGTLPCNLETYAAHDGVTHQLHYLGDKPGRVLVDYDNYIKPDVIEVTYRGQVIGGTGGPRSGHGAFLFDWNPMAGDYVVDVVVTGNESLTRWKYSITCPAAASS